MAQFCFPPVSFLISNMLSLPSNKQWKSKYGIEHCGRKGNKIILKNDIKIERLNTDSMEYNDI